MTTVIVNSRINHGPWVRESAMPENYGLALTLARSVRQTMHNVDFLVTLIANGHVRRTAYLGSK